jgi:hypothetical protein
MNTTATNQPTADLDAQIARLQEYLPAEAKSVLGWSCPHCGAEMKRMKSSPREDALWLWRVSWSLPIALLILAVVTVAAWSGCCFVPPSKRFGKVEPSVEKSPWQCTGCCWQGVRPT